MYRFIVFLFLTLSINTFAQKGIFKEGFITPKVYSEKIDYTISQKIIFVEVEIEGKPYTFLVDTGAPTVLSTNIKGDFKFKTQKKITDASNNEQEVSYVTIPQLKIKNLVFNNFVALHEHLNLFDALGIDGILGANIISQSAWDFDLENKSITVSNQIDLKEVKANFKRMKIKKNNVGTPTLTFTYFDKIKEKNIYFDTGYNDFFYLSRTKYDELNKIQPITNFIKGSGRISESAFGVNEGDNYQFALKTTINSHPIPTFITTVDDDEESNLGVEWLYYYRTILYKNDLYYKESNTYKFARTFESIGIEIIEVDDQLNISFIWDNTVAKQKGLKVKDTILSVNNVTVTPENISHLLTLINRLKTKEKILLEVNTKGNFVELQKDILLSI